MSAVEAVSILPLLILAGTAVLVMLLIAVRRNHIWATGLTLLGLIVAGATLPLAASQGAVIVQSLLGADPLADYFIGVVLAAGFGVGLMAYEYLQRQPSQREEFYVLLLLACLGASVLAMSVHFAALWLGLELLSVSLFGLIAYLPVRRRGLEAGLKYLILAATSSAFLLFGMALIYADLGTLDFASMAAALATTKPHPELVVPGVLLMTTGIGFKLAVVPFHMWTPDVYEGAPAPASGLIATASKTGMAALLLRLYWLVGLGDQPVVFWTLWGISVTSMFAGNLLALFQPNIKRLLAYSSIAHLGYLLVAIIASGRFGASAVAFYLSAYVLTMLGAFGAVCALSADGREADDLEDYRGLFWRHPILAAALTTALLSLAGIPLTAGFWAKFYVLDAGATTAMWALVIFVVINSAIGLFYYLRIVVMMFCRAPVDADQRAGIISPMSATFAAVVAVLVVGLGLFPAALTGLISAVVS